MACVRDSRRSPPVRKPSRIPPRATMRWLVRTAALAALIAGGAIIGGGSVATAATGTTVVAQGCTGGVIGNMGDQVAVQGADVADLVRAGAQDNKGLLSVGVNPDQLAMRITRAGA